MSGYSSVCLSLGNSEWEETVGIPYSMYSTYTMYMNVVRGSLKERVENTDVYRHTQD